MLIPYCWPGHLAFSCQMLARTGIADAYLSMHYASNLKIHGHGVSGTGQLLRFETIVGHEPIMRPIENVHGHGALGTRQVLRVTAAVGHEPIMPSTGNAHGDGALGTRQVLRVAAAVGGEPAGSRQGHGARMGSAFHQRAGRRQQTPVPAAPPDCGSVL